MDRAEGKGNRPAVIAALCGTGALFLVLSLRFGFYYDLNDDWMMGHLLSGAYTGEGELRNIQSLFPLSAVLGGLYRLAPAIPWYPLFLMACQAGAVLLSALCTGRYEGRKRVAAAGAAASLLTVLFFAAELLYHLVFVQYSVTCGMLLAAAAIWILTRTQLTPKTCAVPALLILLGFLLRSEMAVFLLAFPALAFLYRSVQLWRRERQAEEKEEESAKEADRAERRGEEAQGNGRRKRKSSFSRAVLFPCVCMALVLAAGMGLFEGIDKAAYSSPAWTEFRRFFDARTELYDFAGGAPDYAGNEAFYDSEGITKEEVSLYQNYNFALDERIDASMTERIAVYADGAKTRSLSLALWVYLHQVLVGKGDAPWPMVSMILYGVAVIGLLFSDFRTSLSLLTEKDETKRRAVRKSARRETFLKLLFLLLVFAARSALYLYLLYNKRPVVRLTHCLYLLEGILVLAVLFGDAEGETKKAEDGAGYVLVLLVFALAAFLQARSAVTEYARREEINTAYTALTDYAADHPENFYLCDVYSAVDFTEKLFSPEQKKALNWDVAGGWAAKSPLSAKKLSLYDIDDPGEALVERSDVYFVTKTGSDTAWLSDFYASEGLDITITQTDTIGEDFAVLSVTQS